MAKLFAIILAVVAISCAGGTGGLHTGLGIALRNQPTDLTFATVDGIWNEVAGQVCAKHADCQKHPSQVSVQFVSQPFFSHYKCIPPKTGDCSGLVHGLTIGSDVTVWIGDWKALLLWEFKNVILNQSGYESETF